MSDWKTEAQERLPGCQNLIEEAESVLQLWIELDHELVRAYRHPETLDEALIRSIYDYASWTLNTALRGDSADSDPLTAVIVGFYENLALSSREQICKDMARWLSLEDFQYLYEGGAFRYYLPAEDDQQAFKQAFLERKGVRKPAKAKRKLQERNLPWSAFVGISDRKR